MGKLRNFVLNSKGFSLLEFVTSSGITAFVLLAAAGIFVYSVDWFNILVQENHAEENVLIASYQIKNTISQAVNTDVVNPLPPTLNRGVVLSSFDSSLAVDGSVTTLAAFQREAATDGAAGSNLQPTAIFFTAPRAPAANGDSSGVLQIDLRQVAGPGIFNAANDVGGSLIFNNVSHFKWDAFDVNEASVGSNLPAKRITIEIWTRSFKTNDKTKWEFRQAVVPAISFADHKMTVEINMRNNNLDPGSVVPKFVFGGIYFFRMAQ